MESVAGVWGPETFRMRELGDSFSLLSRPPNNASQALFFLDADTFKRRNAAVEISSMLALPEEFLRILSEGEGKVLGILDSFFAGAHLLFPIGKGLK